MRTSLTIVCWRLGSAATACAELARLTRVQAQATGPERVEDGRAGVPAAPRIMTT